MTASKYSTLKLAYKPAEIEANKREKEQFGRKLELTALGASLTISFPL